MGSRKRPSTTGVRRDDDVGSTAVQRSSSGKTPSSSGYWPRRSSLHFSQERLVEVPLMHVTSPRHPLAAYGRPIPSTELAKHVQLVLTHRSALSRDGSLASIRRRTWRLADLGAKHAFLRAGLGWGGMPVDQVPVSGDRRTTAPGGRAPRIWIFIRRSQRSAQCISAGISRLALPGPSRHCSLSRC